jgi:hypothetical protein
MPGMSKNANILALKLDSQTGWACWDGAHIIESGTWDLDHALSKCQPTVIYFEEVPHRSTSAERSLKAALKAWCKERKVPCQSVPGGEIKKFWTGKSNASKHDMFVEARRRGFEPVDHGEASALALLHMKAGIEDAAPDRSEASALPILHTKCAGIDAAPAREASNVVRFPQERRWYMEATSTVGGMVHAKGCIPLVVYDALLNTLKLL